MPTAPWSWPSTTSGRQDTWPSSAGTSTSPESPQDHPGHVTVPQGGISASVLSCPRRLGPTTDPLPPQRV
ncbi:hypothetical protein ACFFX0_01010 [Citricoccus parietis]|uniref:Uncharacterized protein n=1 Tax=Citricoccus parietis TaxID=592307 RepID=A0ABV5FT52_9MICC